MNGNGMIPKYKDGGIVKVQYGSTKDNEAIPPGGMVRSGGKLVPRYAKDMGANEPIRDMEDRGRGLEVVPDRGPPVPGQPTPAEIAKQNKAKREQEAKNRKYSEMDAANQKAAADYEKRKREGKQ
jgi:hypothetical protein